MSYKYYIISPFSQLDYKFVDVSPQKNFKSSDTYEITRRRSIFYSRRGKHVPPSPETGFDIYDKNLRYLYADPSEIEYFKPLDKLRYSSIEHEKLHYGTNAISLVDKEYHITNILNEQGFGFLPWFTTPEWFNRKNSKKWYFGSFAQDYLIVKIKGYVPITAWTNKFGYGTGTSQRKDVARFVRGYPKEQLFRNLQEGSYKKIPTEKVNWMRRDLDYRINNWFSRSWFKNQVTGPYVDDQSEYFNVTPSFSNCIDNSNCYFNFNIISEIGNSLESYKNFAKENFGELYSNELDKDPRWIESYIPIIEDINDISSFDLDQVSPSSPMIAYPYEGDADFSPRNCGTKWKKVTDGSVICDESNVEWSNICLEKLDEVEVIKIQEKKIGSEAEDETFEINQRLEKFSLPSTISISKGVASAHISVSSLEDTERFGPNLPDLTKKVLSNSAFSPYLHSLTPEFDQKNPLFGSYYVDTDNALYSFDNSRIYLRDVLEEYKVFAGKYNEWYLGELLNSFDPSRVVSKSNSTTPFKNKFSEIAKASEQLTRFHNKHYEAIFAVFNTHPTNVDSKAKSSLKKIYLEDLLSPNSYNGFYNSVYRNRRGHAIPSLDSYVDPNRFITEIEENTPPLAEDVLNENKSASGINFTLYIDENGSLFGSGSNHCNQLGLESGLEKVNSFTEIEVPSVDNHPSVCEKVFCGDRNHIVIKSDGSLWGIGCANGLFDSSGEDPITNEQGIEIFNKYVCIHNPHLENASSFAFGQAPLYFNNHLNKKVVTACAGKGTTHYILEDGSLWGLGINDLGQANSSIESNKIILETNSDFLKKPTRVRDSGSTQVSSGSNFTVFIHDGYLFIMGGSGHSQRRINLVTHGVQRCSAGNNHVAFIKNNTLFGFGSNWNKQLGSTRSSVHLGINSGEPPKVIRMTGILNSQPVCDVISHFSSDFTVALDRSSRITIFGKSKYIRGINSLLGGLTFKEQFSSVSCASKHFCYIDNFKNVVTQGSNAELALGSGKFGGYLSEPTIQVKHPEYTEPEISNDYEYLSENLFCSWKDKFFSINDYSLIETFNESNSLKNKKIEINERVIEIFSGEYGVFCVSEKDQIFSVHEIYNKDSNEITLNKIYSSEYNLLDFSVGFNHALLVNSKGDLYGYGSNTFGQLSFNKEKKNFQQFILLIEKNVKLCSAGFKNSIFVKNNVSQDTIFGIGDNTYNRLGVINNFSAEQTGKTSDIINCRETIKQPYIQAPLVKIAEVSKDKGGVFKISLGDLHLGLITGQGKLYFAGHNINNQTNIRSLPSKASSRDSFKDLILEKIGENDSDDLYTTLESSLKEELHLEETYTEVICNKSYSMMLSSTGFLYGSGDNSIGENYEDIYDAGSGPLGNGAALSSATILDNNVSSFSSNIFGSAILKNNSLGGIDSFLVSGLLRREIEKNQEGSKDTFLNLIKGFSKSPQELFTYSSIVNQVSLYSQATSSEPEEESIEVLI